MAGEKARRLELEKLVRRSEWDAVLDKAREGEEAARRLARKAMNGHGFNAEKQGEKH